MKIRPEDENEIKDISGHVDQGNVHVTEVIRMPAFAAKGFVDSLAGRVTSEAKDPSTWEPNVRGNVRSQHFEEGPTFMAVEPVINDRGELEFPSSVYLMNFYDVNQEQVCSRAHEHTGLRLIFIVTGPNTTVNVSSLSPIITHDTDVKPVIDKMPGLPAGIDRDRHTFIVPENTMVVTQIPVGTSHQFNTFGPNAVLISVHPEEKLEVDRETMLGINMMKQTIWLQEKAPGLEGCTVDEGRVFGKQVGVAMFNSAAVTLARIFAGQLHTPHDMARLLNVSMGCNVQPREMYGAFYALASAPDRKISVLDTDGSIITREAGKVFGRVNALNGKASVLLSDPAAAPAIYEAILGRDPAAPSAD